MSPDGTLDRNDAAHAPVAEDRHPVVHQWSVVGHDRILGTVFGKGDGPDGRIVITSPVIAVVRTGRKIGAVALTQSGSIYWLGDPSEAFGVAQAEHFLWFKSRSGGTVIPGSHRTTLFKLLA
jgi:hypothetical protein